MVTATDPYVKAGTAPSSYSDTITVNIMITNVDEDPKLTGPASVRVAEATTAPENAIMYDPATPTYTAADDGGRY